MKIIIHIGPHKTGTTAVQKCLFEGREHLSREGICYPDLGVVQYGHHGLAHLLESRAYAEAGSAFVEMIELAGSRGAETMVLSSEDFSKLRFEGISTFRRIAGEHQIDIAYAQRHPLRQAYSWWQEKVKHGAREPFPQYIFERLSRSRPGQLLEPHIILGRWARQFGRSAIKCLKYREDTDILPDFFGTLLTRGQNSELSSSTNINRSFNTMEVELIRLFNSRGLAGTSVLLDPDFEYLRQEMVRCSKSQVRRFDLRSTQPLRTSIERINGIWTDRFLNLEDGEKPIDDEIVQAWYLDPSFWLLNPDLTQELSAYLARRYGKQTVASSDALASNA